LTVLVEDASNGAATVTVWSPTVCRLSVPVNVCVP
jgi:hypothetical protein